MSSDPAAQDAQLPTTVSDEARAILGMAPQPPMPWPPFEDRQATIAMIDMVNSRLETTAQSPLVSSLYGGAPSTVASATRRIDTDHAGVYEAIPERIAESDTRLFIAIHGSWLMGAGESSRVGAEMMAGSFGVTTWSVDYRMPPRHPYPAALDDCVAAYRLALETYRPSDIIIGGMSGGANLTAATVLRARDEGLPLPAGAVINTPPADLTMAGDSYRTSRSFDVSYSDGYLERLFLEYSGGDRDLTDPYISPLFGDFTKGFPPAILTSGTRDFLLSDTVRMHRALRKAGVPADLHVWEAAPHFMFMGTAPEDRERIEEIRAWMDARYSEAAR